ncbi:hypothetical protein ACFVWL_12370 [Microbacterium sp. NPDC058269]|uniref:hypothetical protein n=1 Tax=Microbacterium sp. NPDC058269 TaxID=3346414 RepID=UPI0036D8243D
MTALVIAVLFVVTWVGRRPSGFVWSSEEVVPSWWVLAIGLVFGAVVFAVAGRALLRGPTAGTLIAFGCGVACFAFCGTLLFF